MKRLLSILLAFLILISNFGFALGTHFCGGKAVESKLMFHQEDLHCGMDRVQMTCDDHSNEGNIIKNKCCENDFLSLHVDDVNNDYQTDVKFNPVFAVAFTISFLQLFWNTVQSESNYSSYHAPPILRSVQTLYQVFII